MVCLPTCGTVKQSSTTDIEITMIKLLFFFLMLTSVGCVAASSEDNDRLRDALKRYPAADADKDGILTMREALAYRAKMRPGAGKVPPGSRLTDAAAPGTVPGRTLRGAAAGSTRAALPKVVDDTRFAVASVKVLGWKGCAMGSCTGVFLS